MRPGPIEVILGENSNGRARLRARVRGGPHNWLNHALHQPCSLEWGEGMEKGERMQKSTEM